eukprot:scaffold731_cov328-Prasinococcus_capsulatus_cf.AAC.4
MPAGADDDEGVFYTCHNSGGSGFLLKYDVNTWQLLKRKRVFKEPITAMAGSAKGIIGCGSVEGHLAFIDGASLGTVQTMKSAHLIFITGLAFSSDGSTLASISADASLRCTSSPEVPEASSATTMFVFILLLIILAILYQHAEVRIGLVARLLSDRFDGQMGSRVMLANRTCVALHQMDLLKAESHHEN